MSGKKPTEPSPEKLARAQRQRQAMEEGAKAMADVARDAVAVRKNMERLRALREARDAEAERIRAAMPPAPVKTRKRAAK